MDGHQLLDGIEFDREVIACERRSIIDLEHNGIAIGGIESPDTIIAKLIRALEHETILASAAGEAVIACSSV
jgi:hypothetical protein